MSERMEPQFARASHVRRDQWCLVICNVCACFILGLLGLGALGAVYRLRPRGCDVASYSNNTESWHYMNDWILFPRYGMCPVGAARNAGYDGVQYTNCLRWEDKEIWKQLDANNRKSNYSWDPSSEMYSPDPNYGASIVLPYTKLVNATFDSTFEAGAEVWTHVYGMSAAACVLIIIGAVCASQLGYHDRSPNSLHLQPRMYCTETSTLVLMTGCVILLLVANNFIVNTLQLNEDAWEKGFFATCEVAIWAESGYSSAFVAFVMCAIYCALCALILIEASWSNKYGAPCILSSQREDDRGNQLRRQMFEARMTRRWGMDPNAELEVSQINSRLRARNPHFTGTLPTAECKIVVAYNANGVASTTDKTLTSPPRVLSPVTPSHNGNHNFEVVATSDIEVGLDEISSSRILPVRGSFIDFYDDDEDEGIVTIMDGSVDEGNVQLSDHCDSLMLGNWNTCNERHMDSSAIVSERMDDEGGNNEDVRDNGNNEAPEVVATYVPSAYG